MNCKFKTGPYSCVDCSHDHLPLKSLDRDEVDTMLSEIGLLFGHVTEKYNICANHRLQIGERNRLNKIRLKTCCVPSPISMHQGSTKGDRTLTKQGMLKIHKSTGYVLPIGIPICSKCRKLLTSGPNTCPSDTDASHVLEVSDASSEQQVICTTHTSKETDKLNLEDIVSSIGSESCFSQPLSMDSQESDASVCAIGKLERLNSFLGMVNVSPVKEKRVPLEESGEKTTKKCVSKALQCLTAICETICPGEGGSLQDMVFANISKSYSERDLTIDSTSVLLRDIYNSAETWTLQRQILSIISKERSYCQVKQLLHDVTPWKYYKAKQHSDDVGCGLPVLQVKVTRNKVDEKKLEHFIDYIVSSNIVKDLPYGMRTMRLTSGEVVEVPNLIRSLAPSSLISQYTEYCASENITHLGSSTLYKILNDCSASARKCIEGLDYYVAEGGRAFNDLETIIEKLEVEEEQRKRLKTQLIDAKRYIKSDYKVHVQKECSVADHCRSFALSEKDDCYACKCSHPHTEECMHCSHLENTLQEITNVLQESEFENKDAILFEAESAVDSIREWKCHILRSRNQEDAKLDLVKDIQDGQLLITCDWAMKFLPRKYREGQTDWFAKRGINWHIAVTIFKDGSIINNFTHVHIFSSQVAQDASVTSSLILDLVGDLSKLLPNSKEIHFFSDNAGCYKNTLLIATLHQKLGDKVKSYNFSEAQDGKGPCDRRSSHIKSCIKRFVNEGHDVTSAEEMKKAIDARQNGKYRVKVVDAISVIDSDKSKLKPIPGITQLNNFSFESAGLRMWKAYSIGGGKVISWTSLGALPEGTDLLLKMDWTDTQSMIAEDECPVQKKQKTSFVFDCPRDGCTKSFTSQKSVEEHLLLGTCDYNQELSLHDKAKIMYGAKVNDIFINTKELTIQCHTKPGYSNLDHGWALKVKKKRTVFNQKQKDFMQEKFNVGKRTGRKVDPFIAAHEMRSVKNGTKSMFNKDEYLTGQQIGAYFSRLAMKDRKTDAEDQRSAEEEDSKRNLKELILLNLE